MKGKTVSISVLLHAPIARRFPAQPGSVPEFDSVVTYVLRVKATEVPAGIPMDANPREPNLNRQVYRDVRSSLVGEKGGTGSFHLKHGGIVLIAESCVKVSDDTYKVTFAEGAKQGIANGGHSYSLILETQETHFIPEDQYVEFKVHTNVPLDAIPDLADGLNSSMQVRAESLADLREEFEWLKKALSATPAGEKSVSWHEGQNTEYDVREVIALLMSLDPTRYPLDNPVGIENTYARVSSVFKAYLSDQERVQGFENIAAEAMALFEYIRRTAADVYTSKVFRKTSLKESRKNGVEYTFPFLIDRTGKAETSDVRLVKPAAIVAFTAFRAVVILDEDGVASWRYPFEEILEMWDTSGNEMLREFHDALGSQFRGNLHYAGRSPLVYRASAKTLEVADLRRQVAASS